MLSKTIFKKNLTGSIFKNGNDASNGLFVGRYFGSTRLESTIKDWNCSRFVTVKDSNDYLTPCEGWRCGYDSLTYEDKYQCRSYPSFTSTKNSIQRWVVEIDR